MSNLTLITTETFNNLPCNFYRNMNDDILLTREQIGQALEYADPIKAIQKIHLKHIEFSDYLKNYMFETECESRPFDLDVVNYYKDIRTMYDTTLDSILEKLNLELPKINRNIFDELADKIAS